MKVLKESCSISCYIIAAGLLLTFELVLRYGLFL